MENGSFDFGGLIKWGADKALGSLEDKIGFPIQEHIAPLINHGIASWGLDQAIELDLPLLVAAKLMMAGIDRQKQLEQQRRANAVSGSNGNDKP